MGPSGTADGGSIWAAGGLIALHANRAAGFDGGKIILGQNSSGAIDGGSIWAAGGLIALNADGSTGFAGGKAGIDTNGNINGNTVTVVSAAPSGAGVQKQLYPFGGIYTTGANCNDNACRYPNPITGTCGCPGGYSPSEFWEYESNTGVYADANPACFTTIHWVRVYQCY